MRCAGGSTRCCAEGTGRKPGENRREREGGREAVVGGGIGGRGGAGAGLGVAAGPGPNSGGSGRAAPAAPGSCGSPGRWRGGEGPGRGGRLVRPSRRPAPLPLPRKSTKARKKVGGGGGGRAPAPALPGYRPCAATAAAVAIVEAAPAPGGDRAGNSRLPGGKALLTCQSPPHAEPGLRRRSIYLFTGKGVRGGTGERGCAPGSRHLAAVGGDTRLGTASGWGVGDAHCPGLLRSVTSPQTSPSTTP